MSSTFDPAGDTRLNYLSMLRDPSQEISSGEGSFSFHETRHLATCESSRCLFNAVLPVFNFSVSYHVLEAMNNCGFVPARRATHV